MAASALLARVGSARASRKLTTPRDVGRATVAAGAEVGWLKADERLSLFPVAREDRRLRLHVGSEFRQLTLGGFAPFSRLVFERTDSSLAIYRYRRTRTEFGVSRAF